MMGGPAGDKTHFPGLHSISPREASRRSPDFLLEVSTSIQQRDRKICLALYNHRVLTTHQIKELFFENDRVCRRRLANLKELGLVKPFRPRAARGSFPNHYILGDLGVYVVAAELGLDAKDLGLRKDRMTKIAFSPKLSHQLAANSFYSRLAWECRHTQGIRLLFWRGELQVARGWFKGFSVPDGEGRIRSESGDTCFLLEMDMGTEGLERIQRKLYDYSELLDGSGSYSQHWVLFCLPDPAREANVRRVAERYRRIWVATSTLPRHLNDPLGLNWLPIGDEQRHALPYLPPIPKKKSAYEPED